MTEQRRPGKYPAELLDRAVRMVFEGEQHSDSQWEAISSVAEKLGPTAETVRKWVHRVEVDEGRKPGLTSDERERLKVLEREVRELRRANEILTGQLVGDDCEWRQNIQARLRSRECRRVMTEL